MPAPVGAAISANRSLEALIDLEERRFCEAAIGGGGRCRPHIVLQLKEYKLFGAALFGALLFVALQHFPYGIAFAVQLDAPHQCTRSQTPSITLWSCSVSVGRSATCCNRG